MNDTTTIVWADPPPKACGSRRASATFPRATEDALRAHPGRWALVAKDVALSSVGWLSASRPGFEFTSRSAGLGYPKGRGDLYARFVGDAEAGA
jgi:hypothetical protein